MATAPSSLIIFFMPSVGVEILQRADRGMDAEQTHTPATPTRSLAPPHQGSLRHMPRPPMCPLYARTWQPAGHVVPTTMPCRMGFRKEVEIRRAARTNPGGFQDKTLF